MGVSDESAAGAPHFAPEPLRAIAGVPRRTGDGDGATELPVEQLGQLWSTQVCGERAGGRRHAQPGVVVPFVWVSSCSRSHLGVYARVLNSKGQKYWVTLYPCSSCHTF